MPLLNLWTKSFKILLQIFSKNNANAFVNIISYTYTRSFEFFYYFFSNFTSVIVISYWNKKPKKISKKERSRDTSIRAVVINS